MRITVIGTGTMGHGIATLCLRAGHAVDLVDTDLAALEGAVSRLEDRAAPGRIRDARASLGDLRSAEVVIDATPQDVTAKRDVLKECIERTSESCLIGTVTLGVPLRELDTSPDSRVVGMHFMNPPHRLLFCELVAGEHATQDLRTRSESFIAGLGLQQTTVADTPGFVLNRLLLPFLFSAVRALAEGVATAAEIDRTFTVGCGHPMGPLAVLDLVGLNVAAQLASDLRRSDPTNPQFQTPSLLLTRLAEGRTLHDS